MFKFCFDFRTRVQYKRLHLDSPRLGAGGISIAWHSNNRALSAAISILPSPVRRWLPSSHAEPRERIPSQEDHFPLARNALGSRSAPCQRPALGGERREGRVARLLRCCKPPTSTPRCRTVRPHRRADGPGAVKNPGCAARAVRNVWPQAWPRRD